MNKIKQILIGSLLTLSAFQAIALPSVTGTLEMTGAAYALDASGAQTSNAELAVAINFDPNLFIVTYADDAFTGLTNTVGNIKDLTFEPFAGTITDFWTIADFSFDLTAVSRGVTNNTQDFLVLEGAGIISATGYEDTAASWSYSSNTSGTSGSFSWSATNTSVPEPGILALLAMGLIGFGLRKKV